MNRPQSDKAQLQFAVTQFDFCQVVFLRPDTCRSNATRSDKVETTGCEKVGRKSERRSLNSPHQRAFQAASKSTLSDSQS